MNTNKLKDLIHGKVEIRKWGMSAVIADEYSEEIAHINPYGCSTMGKMSDKHATISEAIVIALNATYQAGIDPGKIPSMLGKLTAIEERLHALEIDRSINSPVALIINEVRAEINQMLKDIKIQK